MDLHTKGIYAVLDPSGQPLFDTISETGYSARAEFCRTYNSLWSKADAFGYRIAELQVAAISEKKRRDE